jgi:uncharacterized protein YecE (DUF72 family)
MLPFNSVFIVVNETNKQQQKGSFFGGLSGLQLPVPKYRFPAGFENASRLTYYSSFFNSIEINSSFYKIPLPRTVAKWAGSVHQNFTFTFKMFKGITHAKDFQYDERELHQFFDAIAHVGKKRACVLVQFPPSFEVTQFDKVMRLAGLLQGLNADRSWNICFEFRHASWYTEDLRAMLVNCDANLVRHDIPKSATPFSGLDTAIRYQRFHGPTGNYRGDYDRGFLSEFAEYVQHWLSAGEDVFVYFNNTAGNAFNNLVTLNGLLSHA